MIIKRRSPFSGKVNEMDIPVSKVQLECWQQGTLIQNAMPHLTSDQREFIMTGITPSEWEETFNVDTGAQEG